MADEWARRPAPSDADVLQTLPDVVVCLDAEGLVRGVWGASREVLGKDPQDFVGTHSFDIVHPDDVGFAAGALFEAIGRAGEHVPVNLRIRGADGRWVVMEAAAGTGPALGPGLLLLSLRPLGYRNLLDERREEFRRRLLAIATQLASVHASALGDVLAVAVTSIHEFYGTVAVRFAPPRGVPVDVGIEVAWPADSEFGADGFVDHGRVGDVSVFEVEFPAAGPARWWLAWTHPDPGMAGWDGAHLQQLRVAGALAASAAARLVLEADLVRRARLDSLTGLDNRTELTSKLRRMLGEGPATVLFCDLDGFKETNDRYGHAFGDLVLAAAATRLSWALRATDVLGRLGGDEFVAACPFMGVDDAAVTAERLEAALEAPIRVGEREIRIGVSVGSATGDQGADAEALIAAADAAMYAVKQRRYLG